MKEDKENSNYLIIDVRGEAEYALSHYPGAINITVGQIAVDHPQLVNIDKSKQIIFYCAAGGRAEQAKRKLQSLGFNNVINGINEQNLRSNL